MILKNDVLKFKVYYRLEGEMRMQQFDTFASAAGHASGLEGITRFIDVCAYNLDNSSGWIASMYVYSKDNTRRVTNQFAVDQVTKHITKEV